MSNNDLVVKTFVEGKVGVNSLDTTYGNMKDLYGIINVMEGKLKRIDDEFIEILVEIAEDKINVSKGVNYYKRLQRFLRERRVFKLELDSYKKQFQVLGGVNELNRLTRQLRQLQKVEVDEDYFRNYSEEDKQYISGLIR